MSHGQMHLNSPRNSLVLAYLTRSLRRNTATLPMVVRPDELDDPYTTLGAHPEVVQRIWDEIGKALPEDCRSVIHSTPVLLHPGSGTIFVLAMGTGYGLRLPTPLVDVAIRRGARISVHYTDGGDLNARRDLGSDWVLGAWLADETKWCIKAFEYFGQLGDAEPEGSP